MDTDLDYSVSSLANYEKFKMTTLDAIIELFKSVQVDLNDDTKQHALEYVDLLAEEYELAKGLRIPTERFKFEDDDKTIEYVKYDDAVEVINKVIDKLTLSIVQLTTMEIRKYLNTKGKLK